MIENMRKYTGLMVVVFVLLAAGFLFTMNDIGTGSAGGSGPAVLVVHGKSLDHQAYERAGQRTLQLSSEVGLHNYINFLMAPDANQMQQALQLGRYGMNYYSMIQGNLTEQDMVRFVANRIILQHSITEMGLHASEDDISEAIKNLPAFSQNGKYNEPAYALYVEKRLGRLGMTEKHLRDITRENICLNRLVNIIGGGLTSTRSATQDQLEAQLQTVTLAKIALNRDDFVKKENPTEEEIKSHWEAHQDAYKTDEQRRISYYFLDLPEDPEEKTEPAKPDVTETADATETAKKAEAAKAAAAVVKQAKRTAAAKDLTRQIQKLYDGIIDSENNKLPLDFAAIVKTNGGTATASKLFTPSTLPKELTGLTLRGSSNRNRAVSDVIFSMQMSDKEYNLVSAPLPVGENGWLVFVLEEVITPKPLDYTAARNKTLANLISENATKNIQQAAEDARTAVLELMNGGKDFDTAAREKGFTPVQVGPFSNASTPPADEPSAQQLHSVASGLNAGEVSEVINESSRSLFIYVEKRELEDAEENKLRVDNAMQGSKIEFMVRTFLNWINHQYQKAEVQRPADKG